jgi:hypothetical protein
MNIKYKICFVRIYDIIKVIETYMFFFLFTFIASAYCIICTNANPFGTLVCLSRTIVVFSTGPYNENN